MKTALVPRHSWSAVFPKLRLTGSSECGFVMWICNGKIQLLFARYLYNVLASFQTQLSNAALFIALKVLLVLPTIFSGEIHKNWYKNYLL